MIFRNNLIYGNGKHGITFHSQDQTANGNPTNPCTGNVIVNNTIVTTSGYVSASSSGPEDTADTAVFNNVLAAGGPGAGAGGRQPVQRRPRRHLLQRLQRRATGNTFSTSGGNTKLTLAHGGRPPAGRPLPGRPTPPSCSSTPPPATTASRPGPRPSTPASPSLAGRAAPAFRLRGRRPAPGRRLRRRLRRTRAGGGTPDTTAPDDRQRRRRQPGRHRRDRHLVHRRGRRHPGRVRHDRRLRLAHHRLTPPASPPTARPSPACRPPPPTTTASSRRDAAGNLATSADFTFTTPAPPPDTTAPAISAVASSGLTTTGATVTWTTNEASDTQVEYGTTTAYGSSTTLASALVTAHAQTLGGLTAGTVYHYRVKSRDAAGNLATSADRTFTTVAPPDTTAPVISGVAASSVSATGATVSWSTNEAADTQVEYGTDTSYGSLSTLAAAKVTSHGVGLGGLSATTTYHYRVLSRDAAGNLATSADFTFTTSAPADTTGPTISVVDASLVSTTSATIGWTTNEAADTQVEYGATTSYGSRTTLAALLTTNHAATLASLTAGTTYHYRVLSRDAAGNLGTSQDMTFTTAAAPDTAAPTISAVAADAGPTGATISWATNEAADTQVEYGPTTAYGSASSLDTNPMTAHAVTVTGLAAGTLYHFRVRSRDAAGNLAVSADFTLTTAPARTRLLPPPVRSLRPT